MRDWRIWVLARFLYLSGDAQPDFLISRFNFNHLL